ncbi:unnamed protein product, partial [Nesidiocoris tenuis]
MLTHTQANCTVETSMHLTKSRKPRRKTAPYGSYMATSWSSIQHGKIGDQDFSN